MIGTVIAGDTLAFAILWYTEVMWKSGMAVERFMPEITRFNGIIITMYWEADAPHQAAHFHVRYGGYRASYGIAPSFN